MTQTDQKQILIDKAKEMGEIQGNLSLYDAVQKNDVISYVRQKSLANLILEVAGCFRKNIEKPPTSQPGFTGLWNRITSKNDPISQIKKQLSELRDNGNRVNNDVYIPKIKDGTASPADNLEYQRLFALNEIYGDLIKSIDAFKKEHGDLTPDNTKEFIGATLCESIKGVIIGIPEFWDHSIESPEAEKLVQSLSADEVCAAFLETYVPAKLEHDKQEKLERAQADAANEAETAKPKGDVPAKSAEEIYAEFAADIQETLARHEQSFTWLQSKVNEANKDQHSLTADAPQPGYGS